MALNINTQPQKHILLYPAPAWGHVKPLATLAVLMVQARPNVVVTFLVTNKMYGKVKELFATRIAGKNVLASKINLIDAFGQLEEPTASGYPPQAPGFRPAFTALVHAKPLLCHSSGKLFEGLPPITTAVLDPFVPTTLDTIKAVAGDSFPVLAWLCVAAVSMLRLAGPESLGGIGDLHAKVQAEVANPENSDLTRLQVGLKAFQNTMNSGEVTCVPGLPPMFDYELSPQEHPMTELVTFFIECFYPFISGTAGVVIAASSVYEEESEAALRKWYASNGQSMFSVGPLAFPNPPSNEMPASQIAAEKVASSFLEQMQNRFGSKSVFYISFGSMFWPADPSKVWAFLDELIVRETPFIFAHSSPFAAIPPALEAKMVSSGTSLTLAWAPQDFILSHSATGWFLTHAGWNSLSESLIHKVPLVLWPFVADQPINASVAAHLHHIAFELIEVRTGKLGTRKPYHVGDGPMPTFTDEAVREELRALLTKLKGEEGKIVRQNAERLGERMGKVWDEGSESTQQLNAFLDAY